MLKFSVPLSFLMILSLLNSAIELEISVPGFVYIAKDFYVLESQLGQLVSINMLGISLGSLIYGPLSDRVGRRPMMLIGNGILTLGAIGCMMAQTFDGLLWFRLFQGIGAATSAVLSCTMITEYYTSKSATKMFGKMNAILTILMAMSPVCGGLISQTFGWRGCYGVLALISLFSWVLQVLYLPETLKKRQIQRTQHFQYSQHSQCSRFSKHAHPLILDCKKILTNAQFMISAMCPSLLYACYLAFISLSPFIYMHEYHLSMNAYILQCAIIVIAFAIVSHFSSAITTKLGQICTMRVAVGSILLGPFIMIIFAHYYWVTIGMSIFSMGFALIYPIVFSLSMEMFPKILGLVSSLIMCMRYVICASFTAIVASNYNQNAQNVALLLLGSSLLITFMLIKLKYKEGSLLFYK